MNRDSTELLPCPWCKTAKVSLERVLAGQRFAMCDKCLATGPEAKTEAEAIAAWNTRSAQPIGEEMVAEARMAMFLEILSTMPCGESDASDGYSSWINAFCEDHEKRDPDTFNRAIDAGYVHWSHDSDSDNSTIRLTDKGRAAITALKGASHGEG